jgi:SAM-dependent methyltransferase
MVTYKKMMKFYAKSTLWTKLLLWVFIIFIVVGCIQRCIPVREGFVQKEKFILKEGPDVYDEFYVSLYDELVFSSIKNNFEIGEIINATKPANESILLDIGSGTGHHVNSFQKRGVDAIGIDISPAMVKTAQKLFPDSDFKVGDTLDFILFPENSFTHITCLYFTIYYIEDKHRFFQNCFDWLLPGGYLILHLVNRDKFDPILPAADPLMIVSPQKFAKERITSSLVKFNNFQYKANFELNKQSNKGTFTETFKDDGSKNVRQNVHTFHMKTQKQILSLAKEVGFILLGKIDMVSTQYEYQYIYILEKPQ